MWMLWRGEIAEISMSRNVRVSTNATQASMEGKTWRNGPILNSNSRMKNSNRQNEEEFQAFIQIKRQLADEWVVNRKVAMRGWRRGGCGDLAVNTCGVFAETWQGGGDLLNGGGLLAVSFFISTPSHFQVKKIWRCLAMMFHNPILWRNSKSSEDLRLYSKVGLGFG